MLVLIVVTAATVLAAFVASYQKQLQTQEAQTHNRNLESLRVLSVDPTPTTAVTSGTGTASTATFSTTANSSGVVTASGTGFGTTGDAITLSFGSTPLTPTSCSVGMFAMTTITTTPAGAFTCLVRIPLGYVGSTPFAATDATTPLDTITLHVVASPAIGVVAFTIASLSVNPSSVTAILVESAPLLNYTITGDITGSLNLSQGAPSQFTIGTFGEAKLVVSLWSNPDVFLSLNTYIKVELLTTLDNDFSQVFVPPVAVAQISTIQSLVNGTPVTLPLLDGSKSFPTGNSTLVAWSWGVSGTGSCAGQFVGEQVALTGCPTDAHTTETYVATLTTTDSSGLIATSTVSFSY